MKYLIMIYLLPLTAFAQDKLPWYDELPLKFGEWAAVAVDYTSGPVMIGIAGALELLMRLVKTDKPLSIMHGVVGILKGDCVSL